MDRCGWKALLTSARRPQHGPVNTLNGSPPFTFHASSFFRTVVLTSVAIKYGNIRTVVFEDHLTTIIYRDDRRTKNEIPLLAFNENARRCLRRLILRSSALRRGNASMACIRFGFRQKSRLWMTTVGRLCTVSVFHIADGYDTRATQNLRKARSPSSDG
jgi:hypothetical protein